MGGTGIAAARYSEWHALIFAMPEPKSCVVLFVTCLVDRFGPSIALAAKRSLEQAGCQVEVSQAQTCCGQPACKSADHAAARDLALGRSG